MERSFTRIFRLARRIENFRQYFGFSEQIFHRKQSLGAPGDMVYVIVSFLEHVQLYPGMAESRIHILPFTRAIVKELNLLFLLYIHWTNY